jgi:DNA-binding LytR/AlgR family response regulator
LIGEKERRLYPLEPKSIHYVESDGNYVTYRTATAEYLSRDSIKRLAALLATAGFVRIERSLLLNVHAVAFAVPAGHGSFAFTLTSGTVLQSSATYRDNILRMLPFVRTTQTEVTWSPAAEHCSVPLS